MATLVVECPQGHEYTEENVYRYEYAPGRFRRHCRLCRGARYRARLAQFRERIRLYIREAKDRPCADCGDSYPYYVMDFDHRPDEQKVADIHWMASHNRATEKSFQRLKDEIAKCDVVCANCHRIRTFERAGAVT